MKQNKTKTMEGSMDMIGIWSLTSPRQLQSSMNKYYLYRKEFLFKKTFLNILWFLLNFMYKDIQTLGKKFEGTHP